MKTQNCRPKSTALNEMVGPCNLPDPSAFMTAGGKRFPKTILLLVDEPLAGGP